MNRRGDRALRLYVRAFDPAPPRVHQSVMWEGWRTVVVGPMERCRREVFMVRFGFVAWGILVGTALIAQRLHAANGNPGRAAYFQYCSSCHGIDGRGHGVVAESLRPKPADLTQLARKNGGEFPNDAVREIIDGRRRIAAHGTSAMPVWGRVFSQEPAHESPQAHARSQLQLLADYLRSIQAP